MKKISFFNRLTKACQILTEVTQGRWILGVLSTILPLLIMAIFGLVLAIQYDHTLMLSVAIALTFFPIAIPLYFLSPSQATQNPLSKNLSTNSPEDSLILPHSEWSQAEEQIWLESRIYIQQHLESGVEWSDIDQSVFHVLEVVAKAFDKSSLDFTIPEAMTLFEEIGRRYKTALSEHVPGIELIKISHLKAGIDTYTQYGDLANKVISAVVLANNVKNIYFNPLKAAIDIAKQQTSAAMSKDIFTHIEFKAKQALLEEVAEVSIDLYSGRFTLDATKLEITQIAKKDQSRIAAQISPVRVVFIGQTNAGKSRLINMLKNTISAEVDALPCTQNIAVHEFYFEDQAVHFVDTQGIDNNPSHQEELLHEMKNADLIVWVLKANQSARELDRQIDQQFSEYYLKSSNITRKKPEIIFTLNQIDRLKPTSEWQPPYDTDQANSAKSCSIQAALEYNQSLFNTSRILPISISEDKQSFGLDKLKEQLFDGIHHAIHVQRNRQKNEAIIRARSFKNQLSQFTKSTKKIVPKILKKANPFTETKSTDKK